MQRPPASFRSRRSHQSRSASTLAERRLANDRIRLRESVGHDKGRPRDRSQCWLKMIPASNQSIRTEIQIVIRLRIRACPANLWQCNFELVTAGRKLVFETIAVLCQGPNPAAFGQDLPVKF